MVLSISRRSLRGEPRFLILDILISRKSYRTSFDRRAFERLSADQKSLTVEQKGILIEFDSRNSPWNETRPGEMYTRRWRAGRICLPIRISFEAPSTRYCNIFFHIANTSNVTFRIFYSKLLGSRYDFTSGSSIALRAAIILVLEKLIMEKIRWLEEWNKHFKIEQVFFRTVNGSGSLNFQKF